jgi:hypothetical protein
MAYGVGISLFCVLVMLGIKAAWGGSGVFIAVGILAVIHIGYRIVTGRPLD